MYYTLLQMIVEPELRIPDFIKAGADIISVHAEQSSTIHLHRTLNQVWSVCVCVCTCTCTALPSQSALQSLPATHGGGWPQRLQPL